MSLPVITSLTKVKINGTVYAEHPYSNSNVVEVVGEGKNLTEKLGDIDLAINSKEPADPKIQTHINATGNPHNTQFSQIANRPTNLAGYGINDAAPSSHVGAGGTAHSEATTSVAGFMSSADKTKLNGIAAGAQVNPGVASDAEAKAGTDNTKMMTPLRVKAAIETLSPPPAVASSSVAGIVKITDTYTGSATDTALSQKGANDLKTALELLTSVGAKPQTPATWAWDTNATISSNKISDQSFFEKQNIYMTGNVKVNDRVLLMGQTTASQNGIYTVTAVGTLDFTISKLADTNFPEGSLIFVEKGVLNDRQYYYQGSNTWVLFSKPDSIKPGSGLTSDGLEIGIMEVYKSNVNTAPRAYNNQEYLSYLFLVEALAYEIKKIKGTAGAFTVDNTKTLDNKQNKITYTTSATDVPENNGDIVIYYTT